MSRCAKQPFRCAARCTNAQVFFSKLAKVGYADSCIFHQSKGLESASGLMILLYCSISSFINFSGDRVLHDSCSFLAAFSQLPKFFLFRGRLTRFILILTLTCTIFSILTISSFCSCRQSNFCPLSCLSILCHRNFNCSGYVLFRMMSSSKSSVNHQSERNVV